MKRTAVGPGMPRGVRVPVPARQPSSPWWFDYGACVIVRTRDGRRWDVRDVPELARALRDRNAVDVAKLDRWVASRSEEE